MYSGFLETAMKSSPVSRADRGVCIRYKFTFSKRRTDMRRASAQHAA